jgi:hypothetical protein
MNFLKTRSESATPDLNVMEWPHPCLELFQELKEPVVFMEEQARTIEKKPNILIIKLKEEEEEEDIISKDTLTKPLKRKKSTCGHALDLCPKRNSINNNNNNNCCYAFLAVLL